MIAIPGPAAYAFARRLIAQGVRIEDAAARSGFSVEALQTLVDRERSADLNAWHSLGERGVAR